ncbi:MAG: L,D-transpeptidase family protein [Gammaproteobacteria bacterium]|jgi:murein L,D-transpeptidase YafK|nr:L,D-transpeptidase family protein [Gammaproteobacteria bacterium]MDH3821515.1 L,D-transpeptidase family protein [Gammaproteobacteria bacterium]MDH3984089.1 L,D-transpeptidase family protein [Gammaproteobacteria bacterium]
MKLLAVALLVLLLPGLMQASEFPVADRVVIEKGARKLHLIQQGKAFRTYKIALGIRPVGDKKREGDFKTPEGKYYLDARNPNSDYFLSIRISYPDPKDRREAGEMGVDPGGAIMIHGQPNDPTRSETYYRTQDWTNGCIAVSNSDMIDIWLMTGENTPIEIRP